MKNICFANMEFSEFLKRVKTNVTKITIYSSCLDKGKKGEGQECGMILERLRVLLPSSLSLDTATGLQITI